MTSLALPLQTDRLLREIAEHSYSRARYRSTFGLRSSQLFQVSLLSRLGPWQ